MPSAAFESGWQWPNDLPGRWSDEQDSRFHAHSSEPEQQQETYAQDATQGSNQPRGTTDEAAGERQRYWPPRTCRICLETVLPTFQPPSDITPRVFQSAPSATYESPDLGRLIRPCLCKGSQKYVHEGCLNAWRLADPLQKRNYWQCPTCKYSYRLERMAWGKWISSKAAQICLTVAILVTATFVLGYIADPIINLYLDPYGTIASVPDATSRSAEHEYWDDEPVTWSEHFVKGLASLGLLGFAKFFLTLGPWQWWNLRSSGLMGGGGRAGATGRDRLAQISWITILVGVVTVSWAIWKGVQAFSRRMLKKASERVMDVPLPDDADED